MSKKVELEDLRIPRDENGDPLPKYVETEMGKVGYKPQSIGSIEKFGELAKKDEDEASKDELIDIIREVIIDPDLSDVSDEALKNEFDFEKLRGMLMTVIEKVRGPMSGGGSGNLT